MKPKLQHKRQLAGTVAGIRPDHVERYRFAAQALQRPAAKAAAANGGKLIVLDAGCGCGYGSAILADAGHAVIATDLEKDALNHARWHFDRRGIQWVLADYEKRSCKAGFAPGGAVVAFEFLEHLWPKAFDRFMKLAGQNARMIVGSVPNEETVAHDPQKHPWHARHFTPDQVRGFLARDGFAVEFLGGQMGKRGNDARILTVTDRARTIVFVGVRA